MVKNIALKIYAFDLDRHRPFLYQSEAMEQSFISLKNVTLRVRDKFILPETDWNIQTGQNWAVLGPNGVGKSSLVGALAGNVPVVKGKIVRHLPQALSTEVSYVSFDLEQRLIAQDRNRDDARYFSGQLDTLDTARDIISPPSAGENSPAPEFDRIVDALDIRHLLGRGIRHLSTGEMRKILIARALIRSPSLLILDEPFAGLDVAAKAQLKQIIESTTPSTCQLVLVAHRFEEITANITHVLCLKDNAVFLKGHRREVLASPRMAALYEREQPPALSFPAAAPPPAEPASPSPDVLVRMKNVTVRYGRQLVLDRLNWTINADENWAVLGPNGSGKSTLLNLIIGDNQQAYANEIYLFGRRKGSGESLWDIRRKIAYVSSHFQLQYRKKIKAFDVILSGFFDSVGLYRQATPRQREIAERWIETLGLSDKSERFFDQFSYGEKRLILIARAMVKTPVLLILDEPCQGLDSENRKLVLELIEYVGSRTRTRLVYVTHHPDEIPPCIRHILRLQKPL